MEVAAGSARAQAERARPAREVARRHAEAQPREVDGHAAVARVERGGRVVARRAPPGDAVVGAEDLEREAVAIRRGGLVAIRRGGLVERHDAHPDVGARLPDGGGRVDAADRPVESDDGRRRAPRRVEPKVGSGLELPWLAVVMSPALIHAQPGDLALGIRACGRAEAKVHLERWPPMAHTYLREELALVRLPNTMCLIGDEDFACLVEAVDDGDNVGAIKRLRGQRARGWAGEAERISRWRSRRCGGGVAPFPWLMRQCTRR